MKRIFTILAAVLLTASVFAQSPQKLSYQAVVRDVTDNIVTNQTIGLQVSILQGAMDGDAVYTETLTPMTNNNGIISIKIGGTEDFNTIDWENGPFFIKTEVDLEGGTNYTITGTSELLSVPYAIHSSTTVHSSMTDSLVGGELDPRFRASVASAITEQDTMRWNNTPEYTAGEGINIENGVISSEPTAPAAGNDYAYIRSNSNAGHDNFGILTSYDPSTYMGLPSKLSSGTNITINSSFGLTVQTDGFYEITYGQTDISSTTSASSLVLWINTAVPAWPWIDPSIGVNDKINTHQVYLKAGDKIELRYTGISAPSVTAYQFIRLEKLH